MKERDSLFALFVAFFLFGLSLGCSLSLLVAAVTSKPSLSAATSIMDSDSGARKCACTAFPTR